MNAMSNTMLDGLKDRIAKSAKIHQSLGIVVPMNNYTELTDAIFDHVLSTREDFWLYITITKSYDTIKKRIKDIADHQNIRFIDCISRAAGITNEERNCIFIESPVMLEKLVLEMMNRFKKVRDDVRKFVIIDSLSAMMIYNNPETVKEFFQHLVNKTRAEDIHIVTIVVEEELDDSINKIIFLNDKIIKVRESFI